MFRIFEEVDTASDEQPREGHLGLGLAVVARIVSGLGGQMRVESKVGHGSKFTFVLHFRLPGPDQEPKRIDTASESGTQMSRPSHDSSMRPRTSESKDEPKPEKSKTTSSKGTGSSLLSAAHSHVQSQKSGIDSLVEAISSNPDRRNVVIVPSSPQPPSTSTKSQPKKAGQVPVEASRTPLRPMKMDEDVAEPTTQADLDEKPQFFKRPALGTRRTSMYRSLSGGLLSHGRTYTNTNPAAGSTAAAAARTTPGDQNAATKPKARRQSASSGPQLRPLRIMIVEVSLPCQGNTSRSQHTVAPGLTEYPPCLQSVFTRIHNRTTPSTALSCSRNSQRITHTRSHRLCTAKMRYDCTTRILSLI